MAIETINLGNYANDGTGDDLRTAFEKVNNNFSLLDTRDVTAGQNLGAGETVFKQKTASTFQFKTLVAGSNVTLTSDGNTITISGSGTLQSETSPTLGADLNLNGFNVIGGGDIEATVYGIDIRDLLGASGDLNFGTFDTPATFDIDLGVFDPTDGVEPPAGFVDLSAVNQSIIPSVDITYDLGSPTKRFKDLYLSGSSIFIGENIIRENGGNLEFGGSIIITDANLPSLSNPFDQTLNTTDAVEFASVAINSNSLFDGESDTGLNIRSSDAKDNVYIYSYGSDGDGTGAGNIYVKSDAVEIYSDWQNGGAGEKKWTFGTNGELTLPNGTAIRDIGSTEGENPSAGIGIGYGNFNISTGSALNDWALFQGAQLIKLSATDTVYLEGANVVTIGAGAEGPTWTFNSDGEITFPDSTVQTTAWDPTSLGNVSELNDETNGNKLLISADGDLILTNIAGTLETPSFGGVDRGIEWDYGVGNPELGLTSGEGSNSFIKQSIDGLWIHPWHNPIGVSDLNIITGAVTGINASPDYHWAFTNDGLLRFPDGTEQTTAYVTTPSTPLFYAVNVDGNNAYSVDGETWTVGTQLSFNGASESGPEVVNRVALGDNYVVYTAVDVDSGNDNQLWYANNYNTEPTLVDFGLTGTQYYSWRDIEHGGNYTVAVGAYYESDGEGGNLDPIPVMAYTQNGSSWTFNNVDEGYQAAIGGRFESVWYGNNGWLVVNEGGGAPGGAFFVSDPTTALGESNYLQFSGLGDTPSFDKVVFTGDRWWLRDSGNASIYYVSDSADATTATWDTVDIEPGSISVGFGTTSFYENTGGDIDGTYWFVAASGIGQVIASSDGGQTWVGSVPLPYTSTITSATEANPCVVTFGSNTPENTSEKIIISNANPSAYNGTYYVTYNGVGYELYTDSSLSTPVDSTAFGTFVSADVTLNHGTYIDALTYGLGKFIAGNDDEQLFVSTNLTNWSKVNDQSNAFEYWNDISFNANWGAGVAVSSQLTNGDYILRLNANGTIELPTVVEGYPKIQVENNYPMLVAYGTTYAGGPEISWIDGPADDMFNADYTRSTMYINQEEMSIQFDANNTGPRWYFSSDGTTYLAKNSVTNHSYLSTPINADNITLSLEGGNGVQIVADTAEGASVQWSFNKDGSMYLPGAVISSSATPTPGTGSTGTATTVIITNSPNPNWTTGTGAFVNGINMTIAVDGSGNAVVTVTDGGTGHYEGETFGPLVGTALGGSTPADDIYFEVTGIDPGTPTALDLGKQVQIITATGSTKWYTLADGDPGQIMYFVPDSTIDTSVYVIVANARILDIGGTGLPTAATDYSWALFSGSEAPRTICTAIFADGAWCLQGGVTD